jgi:hypothetical protein
MSRAASKPTTTFRRLVVHYLRWRYGGNVYALKPPLGYSQYVPRPVWYRCWYRCWLRPRWVVEQWLFVRYGQAMQLKWPGK